jgi:hypothetical protein
MHQGCATELSKHAKLMATGGKATHSSKELHVQCIIRVAPGVKGVHVSKRERGAPNLCTIT